MSATTRLAAFAAAVVAAFAIGASLGSAAGPIHVGGNHPESTSTSVVVHGEHGGGVG
jgi:hypothetical protein